MTTLIPDHAVTEARAKVIEECVEAVRAVKWYRPSKRQIVDTIRALTALSPDREPEFQHLLDEAEALLASDDDVLANTLNTTRAVVEGLLAAVSRKAITHREPVGEDEKATIKLDLNVQFLANAADWFDQRAAETKEDREHWAMIANARNCREAATTLRALHSRNKAMQEALEPFGACADEWKNEPEHLHVFLCAYDAGMTPSLPVAHFRRAAALSTGER